jgi:hypothetical protein
MPRYPAPLKSKPTTQEYFMSTIYTGDAGLLARALAGVR